MGIPAGRISGPLFQKTPYLKIWGFSVFGALGKLAETPLFKNPYLKNTPYLKIRGFSVFGELGKFAETPLFKKPLFKNPLFQ